ncbi:MAG: MarR family winged helix-turn-helix transcriptional regulator [Microthrixaceae bacterium]
MAKELFSDESDDSAVGPDPREDELFVAAYRLQLAITRLSRLLRQEVHAELTPSQISVLSTIRRSGPITLGELAETERVAPPSVTRMVDRLESDGFVERIPDEGDRRVCRVTVTDRAEVMVAEARRHKAAWLSEHMADLGPKDQQRLQAAVGAIEELAGLK